MKLYQKIMLISGIIGLTSCQGKLKNGKYDTKEFSIVDTLGIDTIEEKVTLEHLYNYLMFNQEINLKKYIRFRISKEDIEFKTIYNNLQYHGELNVSKEECLIHKLLEDSFTSIKDKEEKYIVSKSYFLNRNLEIKKLSVKGVKYVSGKASLGIDQEYRRYEDLKNEKKEMNKYLDKILEYKGTKD